MLNASKGIQIKGPTFIKGQTENKSMKKIQQNLHFSSMDMTRWGTGKKPQLFSHSANRCI